MRNRPLSILFGLLTANLAACDAGGDPSDGARGGRGEIEGDNDTDDNGGSDDEGGGSGDDCVPNSSVPNGSCGSTGASDDGGQGSSGGDDGGEGGEADLPYNMNLQLGDTFKLSDAFLEEGPLPAAILSVEMEGGDGDWRLAELQADTPYVVTQEDCDHEGNHGTGRDRIVLSWQNADGSEDDDHMTIRYCD